MSLRSLVRISGLSLVAGLLYSSWPLGYLLNPKVARVSLASGLEAINQPYNWVFITSDILSSVLIVIVCGLMWKAYRNSTSTYLRMSLACVVLFSFGTTIDALLPEHCVPNLMMCPSFTQDHYLLLHGIFSILASVFLFIALLLMWIKRKKNLLLSLLLGCYILFGFISLIQAITPNRDSNWSQDYYITICSLWLISLPYAVQLIT